jgi:hypothetical protein
MNGAHPHSTRRGSFSLKAIIHDVEQREGRNFSGPEILPVHPEPRPPMRPIAPKGSFSLTRIIQEVAEREGCPVEAPEPQVSISRHEGPRHPRATRQVTLEGNRVAPIVTPLDKFNIRGAGRAPSDRSAPARTEHQSVHDMDHLSELRNSTRPPHAASGATSAVLSLLPELPGLPEEAFLMLYLDASREFERRFCAPGWHDKVLALAARGR